MRIMQKLEDANEQSFICVQIEHIDGMRQLEDILDVPGIDAAFIGPYDLSASMGIAGNFTHPKFQEESSRFLQCCKTHNVVAGIHVVQPNPGEARERLRQGYEMIAYSLDITFLTHSINEGLKRIKKGI